MQTHARNKVATHAHAISAATHALFDKHHKHVSQFNIHELSQASLQWFISQGYYFTSLHILHLSKYQQFSREIPCLK
jgi:hypothetical protein